MASDRGPKASQYVSIFRFRSWLINTLYYGTFDKIDLVDVLEKSFIIFRYFLSRKNRYYR